VIVALNLVQPQIVRSFIDTARAGGAPGPLVLLAALYLSAALLTQAVGLAEQYAAESLGWRATNALRADLTAHCLELDLSFHHGHTPGAKRAKALGWAQAWETASLVPSVRRSRGFPLGPPVPDRAHWTGRTASPVRALPFPSQRFCALGVGKCAECHLVRRSVTRWRVVALVCLVPVGWA
jgi:hypothetical protein